MTDQGGSREEECPPVPDVALIFEQHHDFVWRTIGHLGVPSAAVDDAAQDVFLVVHRRIAEYDATIPIRAWLYGIARRIAYRHRTREAKVDRLRVVSPSGPPLPDDVVEQREAADLVGTFLASQPPEQREVFILAELEGMSGPEIAAAVGAKLNTVYSRLRLSRQQFERALARSRAHEQREVKHASAQ
jgi:RNA polymerase sigma-70 factor (ECF subfamily)